MEYVVCGPDFGALPAYSYMECDVHFLEYGVLGLWARYLGPFQHKPILNRVPTISLFIIDVDKTKHNIFKVTLSAHSSNSGDTPPFLFCPAH